MCPPFLRPGRVKAIKALKTVEDGVNVSNQGVICLTAGRSLSLRLGNYADDEVMKAVLVLFAVVVDAARLEDPLLTVRLRWCFRPACVEGVIPFLVVYPAFTSSGENGKRTSLSLTFTSLCFAKCRPQDSVVARL